MNEYLKELIDKLDVEKKLNRAEWVRLFDGFGDEEREYSASLARKTAIEKYGRKIFIRGIVEFSNYCKNDCFYCGIRCSNKNAERYRLTESEILECSNIGYDMGFRTIVLQSGEDPKYNVLSMERIVRDIKTAHPDCAVTLSLGELERDDLRRLREAGADRYLLRHETATKSHYEQLHPGFMSFEHRMKCLQDLKELGYQTGAGMMIGAPFATSDTLASDMEFLCEFKPHMVGTGPFLPHKDTPFKDKPKGSYELTLFVLSLVRIMLPNVLLPATTALGTIKQNGREQGVLHGANVIMPNLSPFDVRKKYMLYDNKLGTDTKPENALNDLKQRTASIGYEIAITRGDHCND